MTDTVKVMYDDIEISYIEGRDRWVFELRGRERSAESLAKAKEAIDKPEPKEKKPFVRVKAYRSSYGEAFKSCEVTSIAEENYGLPQVWISFDNGDRRKESASRVYPVNTHNDALIAQWRDLQAKKTAIEEQMRGVSEKLESYQVPA